MTLPTENAAALYDKIEEQARTLDASIAADMRALEQSRVNEQEQSLDIDGDEEKNEEVAQEEVRSGVLEGDIVTNSCQAADGSDVAVEGVGTDVVESAVGGDAVKQDAVPDSTTDVEQLKERIAGLRVSFGVAVKSASSQGWCRAK